MFGIGMPELILIMAIALIVIGPKKLPDLARSLGRAMGEFKKATGDLKSSLGVDEDLSQVKTAFDDLNKDIKDTVNIDPLKTSDKTTSSTAKNSSTQAESVPPIGEPQPTSESPHSEDDNNQAPIDPKGQVHDDFDDLKKETDKPVDDR